MPGKFAFRLQPLLEQRKRVEQEKQRDFAATRRIRDEGRRELERLADARRWFMQQLAASARAHPPAALRLRDAHLRSIESALDRQRGRLEELEAAYDRAREALLSASRERRVIEKLKERRQRDFEAEQTRREALELDDANACRYSGAPRKRLVPEHTGRAVP